MADDKNMLGTNQIGINTQPITIEYLVQHRKKYTDWKDLQWCNTFDKERIAVEMKKWRERCPDDEFRIIRRVVSDMEHEETFAQIVLEHEKIIAKMKESIELQKQLKLEIDKILY